MNERKKPELLAPAGGLQHLKYAFAYGADAVYAGMPRYSLRARNNEFDLEALATGLDIAHQKNKQLFVTANISAHNSKVKTFIDDLTPVVDIKPDALIMSDPGLIMMVREKWPDIDIHLSVQANTMNYASVKFWRQLGLTRVILSRELGIEEIAEIKELSPQDMEIEVFVHGALCIAYSGRCLLSGFFNHRDANQGVCTNACRWEYKVEESYTIEEKQRPGELMPIEEDEHGTYIMNSKDLRGIEYIPELIAANVDSMKIEGRTKSAYYIARTVQSYRQAIDAVMAGRHIKSELVDDLGKLANRGYTVGFFDRHADTHSEEKNQNYETGNSLATGQQFAGAVTGYDEANGVAQIDVKNRFRIGDKLELITTEGNENFILEKMQDKDGNKVDVAPGSGHVVYIPVNRPVNEFSLLARYD